MRNSLCGKACEVTEMVLSARSHDMREKDIKYLLDTSWDSEYFSRYLKVFLKSPLIDHTGILSYAGSASWRISATIWDHTTMFPVGSQLYAA